MAEKRYSWTQPICAPCYDDRYPGRQPGRMKPEFTTPEICVDCGTLNVSGIWLRLDPTTATYPTNER